MRLFEESSSNDKRYKFNDRIELGGRMNGKIAIYSFEQGVRLLYGYYGKGSSLLGVGIVGTYLQKTSVSNGGGSGSRAARVYPSMYPKSCHSIVPCTEFLIKELARIPRDLAQLSI